MEPHYILTNGYVDLSEEDFTEKIKDAESIWNSDFYQWFIENQYYYILRYMLPSSRIRNGLDSTSKTKLTTNGSESINNMVKQANQRKWLSEDKFIEEMKKESSSQMSQKQLRSNHNISKEQNFDNIDSLSSSSISTTPAGKENTLEYIPKGGRSGLLASCYACKKQIARDSSRVVWWKRFSRKLPDGKVFYGTTNKVPLCSDVKCITTKIRYGLEAITYEGESLLCRSQLSEQQQAEYKALKEELEIQID